MRKYTFPFQTNKQKKKLSELWEYQIGWKQAKQLLRLWYNYLCTLCTTLVINNKIVKPRQCPDVIILFFVCVCVCVIIRCLTVQFIRVENSKKIGISNKKRTKRPDAHLDVLSEFQKVFEEKRLTDIICFVRLEGKRGFFFSNSYDPATWFRLCDNQCCY